MTRIPPQAVDSEKAVLGSMMQDEMASITALGMLKEDCFYLDAHRFVFRAMKELNIEHKPIDQLTVVEKLHQLNFLDDVGGAFAISDLINRVPTASNVEFYANIVKKKYISRLIIKHSTDLIDKAYNEDDDVMAFLDRFQTDVLAIDDDTDYDFTMDRLMGCEVGLGQTIQTGFRQFDKLFGGLWKKDLVIIAGRPSQGKSALAMSFALSIAKLGIPSAFLSLEMGEDSVQSRLLSMESLIDHDKIRRNELSQIEKHEVEKARQRLNTYSMFVNTKPNWNINSLKSKIRKLHHQGKCEIVFVDYLTYMDLGDDKDRYDIKVGRVSKGLKALAKELDICVVLLSQLSRKPDDRPNHRPMLADLRDSGNIEQDADMVLFPYRDYAYTHDEVDKYKAELIIAKNRNGRIGHLDNYKFDGDTVTYSEIEVFTYN